MSTIDPEAVKLLHTVLESNDRMLYTLHSITDMNARILNALIRVEDDETTFDIDGV